MAKWGISKRGKRYYNWRDSDGQFTDDGIPNSMGSLVDAATKNLGRDLIKNASWRQTKAGNLSSGNGRLPSSKLGSTPKPAGVKLNNAEVLADRRNAKLTGKQIAANNRAEARAANAGSAKAAKPAIVGSAEQATFDRINAQNKRTALSERERIMQMQNAGTNNQQRDRLAIIDVARNQKTGKISAMDDPELEAFNLRLRDYAEQGLERMPAGHIQAALAAVDREKANRAKTKPESWTEKYAREQREGKDNGVADFFKKIDAQYPDDGEDDEDQVNEPKKPETWTQKYAREVAEGKHKDVQDLFKKIDAMYPDNGEDDEDQENEPTKPETWTQKYAREVAEGKHKEIGEFFKRVDEQYPDDGEDDEDQDLPPRARPERTPQQELVKNIADELSSQEAMAGRKLSDDEKARITEMITNTHYTVGAGRNQKRPNPEGEDALFPLDARSKNKLAQVDKEVLAQLPEALDEVQREFEEWDSNDVVEDIARNSGLTPGQITHALSRLREAGSVELNNDQVKLVRSNPEGKDARSMTAAEKLEAGRIMFGDKAMAKKADAVTPESLARKAPADPKARQEYYNYLATNGTPDQKLAAKQLGGRDTDPRSTAGKPAAVSLSPERQRLEAVRKGGAKRLPKRADNSPAGLPSDADPETLRTNREAMANRVGVKSRPAVDYGSDYASMPANQQKTYRSKRRKLIDTAVEAGLPSTEIKRIFSGPMDTWPSAAELKRKR